MVDIMRDENEIMGQCNTGNENIDIIKLIPCFAQSRINIR